MTKPEIDAEGLLPVIDGVLRNAGPMYPGVIVGNHVNGDIYNDRKGRFADGTNVTTSKVKEVRGDLIITANSTYRVEWHDSKRASTRTSEAEPHAGPETLKQRYERVQGEAEPVAQCCMCGKTGLSTVEGDGGTECQLSDGRWTCSQDCWERAVDPTPASDDQVEAMRALLAWKAYHEGPVSGSADRKEHAVDLMNRALAAMGSTKP